MATNSRALFAILFLCVEHNHNQGCDSLCRASSAQCSVLSLEGFEEGTIAVVNKDLWKCCKCV
jgi:hypothetical protein